MTERPVECGQCKKPVKISYKEIVGNSITCTEMCADCPIFEQKLHGSAEKPQAVEGKQKETGIYCGKCHTSLDAVKMGNPLGCSECYNVFADTLISELVEENKIPARIKKDLGGRKAQPIHMGRSPGKAPVEIPSSSRLTALNEALNEALKRENYEEAAWLRDQIKSLTENKSNGGKN